MLYNIINVKISGGFFGIGRLLLSLSLFDGGIFNMADIFDLFKKIAQKEDPSPAPISWILVGLGNPGDQYAGTRHNAGFLAIDALANTKNVKIDRSRFHALTKETEIFGQKVLLMKPQTMMNLSGVAVGEAAAFYKIAPDHVLVLSDDISLSPGRLRVRKKGSAGGHNGLKNIIEHLGSEDFPRIKIGVGAKPHPDYDLAEWVLGAFPKKDMEALVCAFPAIASGVEKIFAGDFDSAMQICNSFSGSENPS